MPSYKYSRSKFYIKDKKNLHIDAQGIEHEFNWIFQFKPANFSLESDPDYKNGAQYLNLIHEISHYYQDLSIPACIGERIYKTRVTTHFCLSKVKPKIESDFLVSQEEIDCYELLYNSSLSQNISQFEDNLSPEICNLLSNRESYFTSFSCKDFLECYAEMKAWQVLINDRSDKENSVYLLSLLRTRNDGIYVRNNRFIELNTFEKDSLARYALIRTLFLEFFFYLKPNELFIYNGNESLIQLYSFVTMNSTANQTDTSAIDDYTYLKFESNLLKWVIFVMDIALTIPPIHIILEFIKTGKYKVADFHPTYRFFKVLEMMYKYPIYFNNIDGGYSWVSIYNDIANIQKWPNYQTVINYILSSSRINNNDVFTSLHEYFIRLRLNANMENYNGSLLKIFKASQIPIYLRFPHFYIETKYLNNELLQLVCNDDEQLLHYIVGYLGVGYDKHKHKLTLSKLFTDLFVNELNMSFYDMIISNKFNCVFPNPNCLGNCKIHESLELFKEDSDLCYFQAHIRRLLFEIVNE